MKRVERFALLLLLTLALLVSCQRDGVSVNELKSQVYVHQNGDMGLSLFFQTDCKDPLSVGMIVKSPSSLTWTLNVYEATFEDVSYFGSADIAMPSGMALEQGTWNVVVTYKDGSSVSRDFAVSYHDVDAALSAYAENAFTGSWYDLASNVTVLGN